MLDSDIKSQLQQAFEKLDGKVTLTYKDSSHADQNQLLELLNDLQQTSTKIIVEKDSSVTAEAPEFYIKHNDKANGVSFKGIPGGHEFTSLVLAILHSDGKGKQPDPKLIERMKNLKGPIEIQTYISLTCENCPEVVQNLNLMAIHHGQFKHQMIDGAYTPGEIESLGIQGVPSVIVNGKLIHSGKANLLELLGKLEQYFGIADKPKNFSSENLGHYEVVVLGAGPAGASSAIYASRKGFSTLLVAEKFGGQVQDTKGIENLISVPYTEGPQLAAQLAAHVAHYPIKTLELQRVAKITESSAQDAPSNKTIHFESGDFVTAQAVIVATGAKWKELGVPGEKEYLGRGVAFCPHCDGPFYKGKKIAVVGGGNSGVEAAIDLAGIVKEVVVIEYNSELKADQVLINKLKSMANVSVITNAKTMAVKGDGSKVQSLEYQDRKDEQIKNLQLDGVFIQIGLVPNSQFLKGFVELSKYGEVVIDQKGRTSTKGIYAAGDVTTVPYKQIIIAMGEGAKAALTVFEDLKLGH
ncbi:MAG: alkyl hydroperoxide reductase subunit F [Pseudobdellovibrionaceae bacterium]